MLIANSRQNSMNTKYHSPALGHKKVELMHRLD